jgi:hypothetical protein
MEAEISLQDPYLALYTESGESILRIHILFLQNPI